MLKLELEFKIKQPSDCSEVEIDEFHAITLKSGQVMKMGLKARINNSTLLGFCYTKDQLISISSVKSPNKNYRNGVFEKAGIKELADDYPYELGYAFTETEFRGNGLNYELNKRLLSEMHSAKIYATSDSDGMIKILEKLGFERIGNSFHGNYNEKIRVFHIRK